MDDCDERIRGEIISRNHSRVVSVVKQYFAELTYKKNTYTQPNLEERFPIFKQISTKWHSFKTDTDRGKYTKLTVAKQV